MKRQWLEGIRAVAFDAVGTVILPTPSAATVYARLAAEHGIAVEIGTVSQRLWERYRMEEEIDRAAGWITGEERERDRWRNIVDAALSGATPALFEELFDHYSQPEAWTVMDGVAEALQSLARRGVALALASNYDRRLETVVAGKAGLAPLRRRLVISSIVGVRKPGLGFFRDGVLPALGCEAGEILFVGDDLDNDYHGARVAGMRAVLFDPQNRHPSVPDRISDLTELLTAN